MIACRYVGAAGPAGIAQGAREPHGRTADTTLEATGQPAGQTRDSLRRRYGTSASSRKIQ